MIAQILLAEDNLDLLQLLAEYLTKKSHHVITAQDGFQLSQKAGEHRPHLIITDIQMPGAYGSSVYQSLQQDARTKDIPIIFISAHPRDRVASILPTNPKTRFLQKPVTFEVLDRVIAELLPMGGYIP